MADINCKIPLFFKFIKGSIVLIMSQSGFVSQTKYLFADVLIAQGIRVPSVYSVLRLIFGNQLYDIVT